MGLVIHRQEMASERLRSRSEDPQETSCPWQWLRATVSRAELSGREGNA